MPLHITFHTPHGLVTMPYEQAVSIATCVTLLHEQGKTAGWHFNACGCCVAVHEDVANPDGGYVIGQDGEYDWYPA